MTQEQESTTEVQEMTPEVSAEEISLDVEEKELFHRMMEVGVFYGRSKARTNPLTKKYILTTRSGYEVIDLQKAIGALKEAAKVLDDTAAKKGTVLFVGTSPAAKKSVRETAQRLEVPFVTERWLGGTLTNFKTITDRINYFKKLKDDKATGRLEKYTKKEQLKIGKELAKLEKLFGGIESLSTLPALVVIADLSENEFAAREAKQKGIPVIAILNTDADPTLVDYPIPGNDRNPKSIALIMEHLETAAARGAQRALVSREEPSKEEKEAPVTRKEGEKTEDA